MTSAQHAFFDFDGTLIEGDSILYWQRYYYGRRPLRRFFMIANGFGLFLYGLRILSSHTLKRIFLWPLSFERPEDLDALARDFVREDLARRWHLPILERLRGHLRAGRAVTVISASGSFYLKHLADILPEGCQLLGTEIEWRPKGFLGLLRFPRYVGGNLRGENKIVRLRALGLGEAGRDGFGYSDHHHDIPLLEFVDFPFCVRPTAKLRAKALENGWPILEWPRERAGWKVKLEAGFLIAFAWAPGFLRSRI